MEEQKTEDYKERLQKVRQRRNGKDPMHWFMIGGCAVIVVLALVIIVKLAQGGTFGGSGNARVASASEAEVQETVIGETLPEDEEQAKEDEEKKNVVESYQNLGIVDVSGYLNMRESASTTSDVIGKLMGGSACEILDDSQEGWYQVSSGGLEGYISSEFVQTGEAAKTEAFELVKKMAVITTDKLNIRSEPSEDAQVLEQALKNERYSIVSEQDGWIQISGGYISADYVDVRYALPEAVKFSPLDGNQSLRNKMVNYGLQFVGNRYVWGGNDPHTGADCSGFAKYVYSHVAGITLPRTSREQARQGTPIKSSQMRPGDLIFYANSGGTVNHVAMYIGNGQIVHAASRRSGIKISTWNYRTPYRIVNMLGD